VVTSGEVAGRAGGGRVICGLQVRQQSGRLGGELLGAGEKAEPGIEVGEGGQAASKSL
jgi:hypothetical protein